MGIGLLAAKERAERNSKPASRMSSSPSGGIHESQTPGKSNNLLGQHRNKCADLIDRMNALPGIGGPSGVRLPII